MTQARNMPRLDSMSTRARVIWAAVAVVIVGGAFGLYWFQPWKLFTSKTVNEVLPTVATAGPT